MPKIVVIAVALVCILLEAIGVHRIGHRTGLVEHQNNICRHVLCDLSADLFAGGVGFQGDGIGAILIRRGRFADFHALFGIFGGIIGVGGQCQRARNNHACQNRQGEEKGNCF